MRFGDRVDVVAELRVGEMVRGRVHLVAGGAAAAATAVTELGL